MRAHVWAAIIAMAALAPAQAQQAPGWIADRNGCRVWNSIPHAGETIIWSGRCKRGYADGYGALAWLIDGKLYETYTGDMEDGHFTGHGTQIYNDGAIYTGDYMDDNLDGPGIVHTPEGDIFSGIWANHCFKGVRHRGTKSERYSKCE
jgi:hypothetical protein